MTLKFPFKMPRAAKTLAGVITVGAAVASTACLDRPVGREQPKTTNVIVDTLVQSAVDKIDLLFMIDNSISMADKQEVLALALPDLVGRLVSPACVNNAGEQQGELLESANDRCPQGTGREFNPISNIHIGVITSSLGGFGAEFNCRQSAEINSEQSVDMAMLLGSLPRGAAAAQSAAASGFLSWNSSRARAEFSNEFAALVRTSGEHGCGWEASLEAWYRFLVEPFPYTEIVRQPCNAGDTGNSCAGPATSAGGQLVNTQLLAQRAQFLRPDSLLAIIMLSDENDCSFKATGQTWRLSQTEATEANGRAGYPAFKGTAACSASADGADFGPNGRCCHSCGQTDFPSGCPSAANEQGATVAQGCEAGRKFDYQDPLDNPNLRCYQQKRRFGVDYLYPVERYSQALIQKDICPYSDTLAAADCATLGVPTVPNPLYADLTYEARKAADPDAVPALARNPDLIFLAGIVGVPWQDVAVSHTDPILKYRVAKAGAPETDRINWNLIIGERNPVDGIPRPTDPLMLETVEPRTGQNPVTMDALEPPGSGFMANPINGHEWNISDGSDLQYACIFPKAERPCPTYDEAQADREAGLAVPNCDCTDYPGDDFGNPLCQAPGGAFDTTQRYAKAYPSLRELQVLHDYGDNSIVASICPKETDNQQAADFGYRPAVAAIIDRLKEQLADKCLTRSLSVKEGANGMDETACIIIEAKRVAGGPGACDTGNARDPIEGNIDKVARRELQDGKQCRNAAECAQFQLCAIRQLTPSNDQNGYTSCLNDNQASGDGWCYVDPSKGLGSETLVEKCPDTAKRKLRFIGAGTPEPGTVTLVACSGEAFNDETGM